MLSSMEQTGTRVAHNNGNAPRPTPDLLLTDSRSAPNVLQCSSQTFPLLVFVLMYVHSTLSSAPVPIVVLTKISGTFGLLDPNCFHVTFPVKCSKVKVVKVVRSNVNLMYLGCTLLYTSVL